MKLKRKPAFPAGVHPTDGSDKALSMNAAAKPYWPDTVTILSEQTFGGKCRFLVKPGDHVTEGQLIGEPETFMAAPLHASVTGKVTDIREVDSQGRRLLACIIKRDGEHREARQPYQKEIAAIDSISKEDILAGIRDGGLTGMGGAGFPTHRKYETEKPVDALLINGAECEPYLTGDYRLMLEDGYGLINGIRLLLKGSGADRAYLCVEDNKPEAIENLKKILPLLPQDEAPVTLSVLPAKYPQGGERQLIQAVLGREVPMGGLPADAGVIVSNVGTARAAADMILGNLPLTRRIVTVTGLVKNPGNYLVPVGTSAGELIRLSGGVTEPENRVIAGGPMTGPCAAEHWDGKGDLFYVTKNTSGILVLKDFSSQEQPCIRCSGCETVCPAGLVPYQIDFAYLEGDYDLCEKLYASECIACGCCSYICPAKRELSFRTRSARDIVKQRMRERAVKKS